MASYHFSMQSVKRSQGRSVVAMAAYRAGERLLDQRRGVFVDFRRRGGVVHAEILAPEGAAEWLLDRESLWNGVEQMEIRKDAQLAREINMALPYELEAEEQLALLRGFVLEHFVALGMVADIAIHAPVVEKRDAPQNFHAHVLLTMRQAGAGGLRRVKTREWNSEQMLLRWRSAWAAHQNRALEAKGWMQRVDHRSLAVQRQAALRRGDLIAAAVLDRAPEIHVGPKARKAARLRVPQSKVRPVGRARKTGQRRLRYPDLDRGSRQEWNMRSLARNARRFSKAVARTEVRLMRARKRLAKYQRALSAYRMSSPSKATARRTDALIRPRVNYKHLVKRRNQVLWIIDQLDRLFLALLGIREAQLTRHTIWANRLRWRRTLHLQLPVAGRVRSRWLPS